MTQLDKIFSQLPGCRSSGHIMVMQAPSGTEVVRKKYCLVGARGTWLKTMISWKTRFKLLLSCWARETRAVDNRSFSWPPQLGPWGSIFPCSRCVLAVRSSHFAVIDRLVVPRSTVGSMKKMTALRNVSYPLQVLNEIPLHQEGAWGSVKSSGYAQKFPSSWTQMGCGQCQDT